MADGKQQLHGPRYLIAAVGLSSIPRLITSVLTLVTFPLVLRAIGASEYGVFVYVTATLSVAIFLSDFGVTAASGKAIAEARPSGLAATRRQLIRCVRLQAIIGSAGLIPVALIAWTVIYTSKAVVVGPAFLFTMILATWLGVATAFARSCLQSYLAFGWLAVLDTVESLFRSAGWIVVAWFAPTNMALAVATLITSVVTTLLGATILFSRSREKGIDAIEDDLSTVSNPYRRLIVDSVSFLGIGLATRVFASAPYLIFGRLIGAEVVGVLGAFTRLLEMVSFPFTVLGNALAVRAAEVKAAGLQAVVALWDACFRFVVVAAGAMGAFLLVSDVAARTLVPDSSSAPALFAILSVVVLTNSTSYFIATMSDFVGAIKERVAFLAVLAIGQIPVLFAAAKLWHERGGITAYAAINIVMICGYIVIAKRAFFGTERYSLPPYIVQSFGVITVALMGSLAAKVNILSSTPSFLSLDFLVPLAAYIVLLCAAFAGLKRLRERFLTLAVFEFMGRSRSSF